MVGSAWPVFSVPGTSRSSTIFVSLKIVVVVAKEPMPSVSKKLVKNPTNVWSSEGKPPAWPCAPR